MLSSGSTTKTTVLLVPSLLLLLSIIRPSDGQSSSNIELTTMPEPVVTRQNVLPPDDPPDVVEIATMPEPAVLPPDDPPVVGGFDIVDAPDVAVQMPEPALSDVPAPADLPELDPSVPSLGAPQGGPQGTLGVGLPPGDLDDIIVPVILTRPKCRTDTMRCPDGITEIGRDLDDSCKFPECPPVTVDGGGGPQMSTGQRDDHLDDSGLPQLSPGGPMLLGGPQLSPANHAVSDDPPIHAFVTASPPQPLRIMECYGTCPRLNCPLHHQPIHTDDACCPHCELDCTNAICPDLGSVCGANEDLVFSEGKCCPSCVRRNTCTDVEGIVQPSVTCLFDPCHEEDRTTPKTCDGHPEAVCRKDQCNGCRAVWTVMNDSSDMEEIVECSKCKSDAKDCGNGVYVKRDSDANCEFPLCPKDRMPTLIASGPLMGPMGGGPMGSLGQGGNLAPGPGGGPDQAPAVLEPVMLDCSLVLCKRETCVTGGMPYAPPGECCPVCPPPAIFCPYDAKMCSDGSNVSRDPMNMCKFPSCPEEEDATNSGGATAPRIDSGEVLPVVMIDPGTIPPVLLSPQLDCKMIPCEEPVCAPNVKPHYPDGQCCPICDNSLANDPHVEECRHVECLSPLCVEGETPLVPEGECCPVCGVLDCKDIPCPEPICESGETPVVPFGKCCPHCPPMNNQCRNPFTGDADVTVRCIVDPCEHAECPLHPEATCRANYCGGCHAIFEVDDEVVECHERTFCTKDARICGDGVTTLVRDHNNNCEFPDCPLDECDERREDCPEVPKECEDGFLPAVPEGECCPSCERKEPVEKCEGVSCPVVPSYCWDNTKPATPTGECCPVCPPEPTKDLPTTTTEEPPKADCENKIGCEDCVESGCAWDGGLCFDSCSDVVDPTDFCYVAGYLNLESAQEVCEAAKREREDEELCFRHEDCSSCVAEVKGDGENCVWIDWGGDGDDSDGECAAKPLMGRGSTVCLRSEMSGPLPPLPPDLVAPEPLEITFDKEVACWSTSLSCTECLSLGCEGWYGSCLPDCSRIADTKCWSLGMSERFGDSFVTYGTVEAVCDLFEIDKRDGSLCDSVTTCDECVTTTRADGVRKCKWIEPSWGGDGFCALDGGMMGPASEKCPAEPEVRAPEVHVTAGPNLGPPEVEDVLVCTADVATCSDGRVVGRDPTDGCRFPCDVVVPEVPIEVPITAGPDLGPCAMVKCQDVVCSDGSRGYVPTGECCPTCLPQKTDGGSPCDGVLCPQIRCSGGTPLVPEGECCERCPPSPDPVVVGCQEDARVCPDGTVIVRDVDLGCDFPDCPPAQTEKPDEKCKDVVCPQVRCSDGTPFVPQGECCERCPPPDTLVGCPEDARVCPDGTVIGRDFKLKCEFPDCPPAKTEKPLDEKCKDVVCPYVEPVCKHGKHYVAEGECCRRCPPVKHDGDGDGNEKKCDPSLCTKLKCPPKHEPVVPEGECCPVCVPEEEEPPAEPPTRCAEVACPAIALICDYDQKPVVPEGSCCPACPPVACEEDYRTCEDGTVLKRDPTNRCVMPECPKPNRPKPVVPDDKDGDGDGSSFKEKCPEPVACKGNPCRRAYCAAYSSDEVECVPSYCGVCGAIFVDKDNNEVDCSPKKFGDDEDEPDNLRDKAKKYAKATGFKKAAGRGKKAVAKKANIRGGGGGGGFAKKGGRRKFNGD